MLAAPRIEACVLSLKRAIRRLETETIAETASAISFGIGAIDGALGGGLSRGMLHEIAAANETEIAAASGFALALTVRNASLPAHANVSAQPRAIVWIAEDMACRESGALY
jgi:protein ImuA